MTLSLVSMFTHDPGEVQIGVGQLKIQFFKRFAAGACIRRFTLSRMQFAAARAPETEVRFLGALQQEHVVLLIEDVKQRGDLVRKRHAINYQQLMQGSRSRNSCVMGQCLARKTGRTKPVARRTKHLRSGIDTSVALGASLRGKKLLDDTCEGLGIRITKRKHLDGGHAGNGAIKGLDDFQHAPDVAL